MNFQWKPALLLLCLCSCSVQGVHKIGSTQDQKTEAVPAKAPDNIFVFYHPVDIVAENIKRGLDCALNGQPHQTFATDLGQSTEIWVQGATGGDDASARVQLTASANATIAEIISPAPPGQAGKKIKLYGNTGSYTESPTAKQ